MRVAIVGGGVIGLSLAWELARRGHKPTIIEKERLGRAASWAGAGILPPSNLETAIHPMEHLEGRSDQLHPQWAERLKKESGIDTGFLRCGGLYIARTLGEKASLSGRMTEWDQRKIETQPLDQQTLRNDFADLHESVIQEATAWWAPGETQICNPRHVEALAAACRKTSVTLLENCGEGEIVMKDHRVSHVLIHDGEAAGSKIEADAFCITAGPWSGQVAGQLAEAEAAFDTLPMVPVRGQMLLYKLDTAPFTAVVNEGTRYLVPRADGHVLFGATIEEVGFDTSTTDAGLADLKAQAVSLLPALGDDRLVKTWAGLRPATFDGFPYIGAMPQTENLFVAAGHFKAGLHLSPATAEVMADLIEGITPSIDLKPFAPSRVRMT